MVHSLLAAFLEEELVSCCCEARWRNFASLGVSKALMWPPGMFSVHLSYVCLILILGAQQYTSLPQDVSWDLSAQEYCSALDEICCWEWPKYVSVVRLLAPYRSSVSACFSTLETRVVYIMEISLTARVFSIISW